MIKNTTHNMNSPRCPSCKKTFHKHLGLAGTCAQLIESKKQIKNLSKMLREAVDERDAARKINKELAARIMGSK